MSYRVCVTLNGVIMYSPCWNKTEAVEVAAKLAPAGCECEIQVRVHMRGHEHWMTEEEAANLDLLVI